MGGFRVTKYDPALRLQTGVYAGDDWTSVSDIGRSYGGQVLSYPEYLRVETSYVLAARTFLEVSGLNSLRVADLQVSESRAETFPSELAEETLAHIGTVTDGAEVRGADLDWVVRLALREALWCRLEGEHGFHIHFGYDYYMYIGSEELGPIPPQLPPGIFAEAFESPWRTEAPDR